MGTWDPLASILFLPWKDLPAPIYLYWITDSGNTLHHPLYELIRKSKIYKHSFRKIHCKVSYDFLRFTLRTRLGDIQFLVYPLNNSWLRSILSIICLPSIKDHCDSPTRLFTTRFSLLSSVVSTIIQYGTTSNRSIVCHRGRRRNLRYYCDNCAVPSFHHDPRAKNLLNNFI